MQNREKKNIYLNKIVNYGGDEKYKGWKSKNTKKMTWEFNLDISIYISFSTQ